MRGELIALDLETTGLNVETDSIIEIGAVRILNGEVIEEFGTLINPGFVIPAETTHITGIHQDDLRHAPTLASVLPQISEFVGDAPVIAHNASFDINFMRRFNTLKHNLTIDTYELASILMPRVARYSLTALTKDLGIDLENAHRALDDARATGFLYWHLWQKALQLPVELLDEIVRDMQGLSWESGEVFKMAHQSLIRGGVNEPIKVSFPTTFDVQPVLSNSASTTINTELVAGILDADGAFSRTIPQYEHRESQVTMAKEIATAFNQGTNLLIEAGTGTGKSLAYLTPAVEWAVTNNERVVISTNTIQLQDQILKQDVPLLRDAIGQDFRVEVMKGRSHYLCPRRLDAIRRRQPNNVDELRTLAKILIWLQESQTGDRGEITLRANEYYIWNRLSAEDEGCVIHRCASQMQGSCPYYQARQKAESAHLLITNHALLISDAMSENRVLPDYRYLIVDEAHQLEDAVTNGLSIRVDYNNLNRRLSDLGTVQTGLLGDLLKMTRGHLPDKHQLRLESFVQDIAFAVKAMSSHIKSFFETTYQYLQDTNSDHNGRVRLDNKRRSQSSFSNIGGTWHTLAEYFATVTDALNQLASAISKFERHELPQLDDHIHAIVAVGRHLDDMYQGLDALVAKPDSNAVYWINSGNTVEDIVYYSAPLHVGSMMEQYLWDAKESVVLTSATLRSHGSFDFIQDRLHAEDVKVVSLGSPFDYKSSTLVYVPNDIPMPQEQGYQKAVERGIVELAAALNGRVLALFTSYAQLRETAANISARLALGNITVYDQATGGSREALLDSFKTTERAVLLGTRSFWEGVDIPGDNLSALVIVRLPFAVPNDPVFAARSSTYQDAFNDYAVPDAILRFRQGFGRLIRTKTDRGIVTIFDSRVVNKSYGMKFLDSLPEVTLQYGKLSDLPSGAVNWLSKKV